MCIRDRSSGVIDAGIMTEDDDIWLIPWPGAVDGWASTCFFAHGATPPALGCVASFGRITCDFGRGRRIPVAENLPGAGGVLAKRREPTNRNQIAMIVRANTRPRMTINDTYRIKSATKHPGVL